MGWNNTTMKVFPGTQTQGQYVLYLLHLYLPTLYTLQVATRLFLGHFRDIYFCNSYFWELCQIGNCSNLYLPHKNVYPAASVILFLATPRCPQGAGTSLCRKKEWKIIVPTRLGNSQAPSRTAGTLLCLEQQPCSRHPGRFPHADTDGRQCWGVALAAPQAALLCVLMWWTKCLGVFHQAVRGSLSDKQALQQLLQLQMLGLTGFENSLC